MQINDGNLSVATFIFMPLSQIFHTKKNETSSWAVGVKVKIEEKRY
jgi:hypothetical protein